MGQGWGQDTKRKQLSPILPHSSNLPIFSIIFSSKNWTCLLTQFAQSWSTLKSSLHPIPWKFSFEIRSQEMAAHKLHEIICFEPKTPWNYMFWAKNSNDIIICFEPAQCAVCCLRTKAIADKLYLHQSNGKSAPTSSQQWPVQNVERTPF